MNLQQLRATKTALKKQLLEMEIITEGCHSCTHYSNYCNKFNAKPPDDWKIGPIDCEEWEYDNIPF